VGASGDAGIFDREAARRHLGPAWEPGGDVANGDVTGITEHMAEAIEIVFEFPKQTSYRDILEFSFRFTDPTTVNSAGEPTLHELPLGDLPISDDEAAPIAEGHDRGLEAFWALPGAGRDRR